MAQVARRYALNASLVFNWLRDSRYAPDPAEVPLPGLGPRFLPEEIVAEAKAPEAMPAVENHIKIELAGRRRMRISGSYDPERWHGSSGG